MSLGGLCHLVSWGTRKPCSPLSAVTLYVAAAVIPALWLPAMMAARAPCGSGRSGIPGRGLPLAHPAPHLALDIWFQHLADRKQITMKSKQLTLFLCLKDYGSLNFENLTKTCLIILFLIQLSHWWVREFLRLLCELTIYTSKLQFPSTPLDPDSKVCLTFGETAVQGGSRDL